MIAIYLIAALIVNLAGWAPGFIDRVNTIFSSDMSGVHMFWCGLLAAFIYELIKGDD